MDRIFVREAFCISPCILSTVAYAIHEDNVQFDLWCECNSAGLSGLPSINCSRG